MDQDTFGRVEYGYGSTCSLNTDLPLPATYLEALRTGLLEWVAVNLAAWSDTCFLSAAFKRMPQRARPLDMLLRPSNMSDLQSLSCVSHLHEGWAVAQTAVSGSTFIHQPSRAPPSVPLQGAHHVEQTPKPSNRSYSRYSCAWSCDFAPRTPLVSKTNRKFYRC